MAVVKQTPDVSGASMQAAKRRLAPLPIVSLILGALSFAGILVSIWMIFLYAPEDAVQGQPQRIFYFHVPAAWLGIFAWVLMSAAALGMRALISMFLGMRV